MCVCIYIYIYIYTRLLLHGGPVLALPGVLDHLGDSKNTQRLPLRHPLIRRIAKQLNTTNKHIRGTRYLIRTMDKPCP